MNKFLPLLIIIITVLFPVNLEAGVTLDVPFAPVVEAETTLVRPIYGHAVQPDGKIVIGGSFTILNGQLKRNFARLNSDGSIDTTFDTGKGTDSQVEEIAVQADGKIIIAGLFSEYNGISRHWIARVNTDGSLDASFVPELNGQINAIYIQSDNKILLGGNFTSINGTTIRRIARLNEDGSLDTTFDPGAGANSHVRAIAVQTDGKILIGGEFFLFNNTGNKNFLRLNADGSIDNSFNLGTGAGSIVYTIAIQADGKIVIGGTFDTYNNIPRNNFARINSDGTLDTTLNSPFAQSTIIRSVDIQTDGKFIVLGNFFLLGGQQRAGITRLETDGTIDTSFGGSGFDNNSNAITATILPDGKILASGSVNGYNGNPILSIVRINSDGSFDSTFNTRPGSVSGVNAIAVQTDGKIVIGGNFGFINGFSRNRIARLNADGTTDTSFNPGTGVGGGYVNEIAIQADGKIIIVGFFSSFNSISRNGIARLNADGSLDTAFNTGVLNSINAEVDDVKITQSGKILVSGLFRSFNGVQRINIAQFNADGTLDTSFVPTADNGRISAIAVQTDGKIVIGGLFSSYGGVARKDIARINADGTLDPSFNPGTGTSNVFDITLQTDGKIIIGGSLFSYNGTPRNGVARVNTDGSLDTSFDTGTGPNLLVRTVAVDSRGKILIGGDFTQFNGVPVGHLARLNSNGTLDQTFTVGEGASGSINAFGFQSGSKLLIGGSFTIFNNTLRASLVRLLETSSDFDYDGDSRADISIFRPSNGQWWINRSSGGVFAAEFGNGNDKIMPGDFTGDGKTDLAFWRETTGEWFVLRSEDFSFYSFPFGSTGDVPLVGDFDGDGKADATVFRPSTATWFINASSGGLIIQNFGLSGDVPVVGDYDGDGKADIAIFRPSNGQWWINRSSGGITAGEFGTVTDKPVQSDFTGDGKTDLAFWRETTGEWFVLRSEDASFYAFPFGTSGDIPVPADYDGDGKTDASVFRPSNTVWYLLQSQAGFSAVQFGTAGDVPTPAAFRQ